MMSCVCEGSGAPHACMVRGPQTNTHRIGLGLLLNLSNVGAAGIIDLSTFALRCLVLGHLLCGSALTTFLGEGNHTTPLLIPAILPVRDAHHAESDIIISQDHD